MSSVSDPIRLALARRKRSAAKLSLTPLVDCVFILLIFFMLQSNLLQPHSMSLQQTKKEPPPSTVAANDTPTVIYVELQADGSLWLDGARHTPASIRAAVRALDLVNVKSAIVAADPGVPLQRAVDMIDLFNARGLTNVSLREARQFK
jgi:biopolymer transport protein ExbD